MTEAFILNFTQNALMMALILMAPILVTSLLIGTLISLFQAATQINEATLTFIPKVVGIGLVLAVFGSWMAQQMLAYTANLLRSLPTLPY